MAYEGILLIDKPEGFTSFDVVAKLRGITKTKKIGHAGTLDPMATGVLPVFFGRGAKACGILPREDKQYLATVRLGVCTDTQDRTGSVLERRPVTVSPEDVLKAAASFLGPVLQIPPMYSAIKVNGRKLCDLARQGVVVERKPRPVVIHSLTCRPLESDLYELDVHCSKGTYIRTLAADLGEALGCGATLEALRRTMAAGFALEDCITLETASSMGEELEKRLLPVEYAFQALPGVLLTAGDQKKFQNGARVTQRFSLPKGTRVRVSGPDGFLGTGIMGTDGTLQLEKLFRLAGEA